VEASRERDSAIAKKEIEVSRAVPKYLYLAFRYPLNETKKMQELKYIYPIFLPSPPFSFPPVLNTPPGS
jgi:hypothetical protein